MFKRNVLYRDNYKCVCCGKKNPLEVHHLYSYDKHKELVYEITNGVTLCKNCHANFHNLYGKGGCYRKLNKCEYIYCLFA
jgi:5-methylcytosine-specific restriction endonuclease McrA